MASEAEKRETLRELFCGWCPNDCRDRDSEPLTDEERAGCVASTGFAGDAMEKMKPGGPLSPFRMKVLVGKDIPEGMRG